MKAFQKRVNRDNTKFRDKIAYVGVLPFVEDPWPFGERRSRNMCRPVMLFKRTPKFETKQVLAKTRQSKLAISRDDKQ